MTSVDVKWVIGFVLGSMTFFITAHTCANIFAKIFKDLFSNPAVAASLAEGGRRMSEQEASLKELTAIINKMDRNQAQIVSRLDGIEKQQGHFETRVEKFIDRFTGGELATS